jgi:hypothetical protein
MAEEKKGAALTPETLASLLSKLDEVMTEAARLRAEVSRQLTEQRNEQQQQITPPRPRKPSRKKR